MHRSRENTSSVDQNTSHVQQPKYAQIKGFHGFNIRPNSPRTQQACHQLGIEIDVLDIKQFHHLSFRDQSDFNQGDVNVEIAELRYQHYLHRTHQLFSEINAKRKEIVQKGKQKFQPSPDLVDRSKTLKLQNSIDSTEVKKHIDQVYNKTISCLQKSTDSLLKSPNINNDLYELNQLEGGMNREITRYNKHKSQKLKEAQIKLQEDGKRLELLEKIKQKDKHVLENLLRKQQEGKLKHQESYRKRSEHKESKTVKPEQRSLQRETEKSRQSFEDSFKKSKTDEQRRRMIIKREEEEKRQQMEVQEGLEKIEQKLALTEKMHQQQQQQKVRYLKEKYEKEQELIELHREINVQQSQEHLSNMISRMIGKEKDFRQHLKSQLVNDLEKKQQQKDRQFKLKQKKDDIYKDQDEKLRKLNERFERIEDQNRIRKNQQEHKILLKQELRRLKEQDKIDNNERQKRMNDYKMQSIYEKSRMIDEKKELKYYQLDVLQKASIEINKHESNERQRIYSQLQELSDNLFMYKSNSQHEPRNYNQSKLKSLKLLKGIANPNDPCYEKNQQVVMNVFNKTKKQSISDATLQVIV